MEQMTFQSILEKELTDIAEKGDFITISLSDESGLVLVMVGNRALASSASAVSSLSLVYKNRVEEQLALTDIDEVSTVSANRFRYINRYFYVNNELYVISIIVRPNHSYRRLSNQVISRLQNIMSEHNNR